MSEKELLEFFLTEADELIGNLEKGFLELDENPSDPAGIQELFRYAHTLKGSAALVKLGTLSKIAHTMEDVLESLRDGQITVTKEIVDWFLHSLDSIKFVLSETAEGRSENNELLDEICSALKNIIPQHGEKHPQMGANPASGADDESEDFEAVAGISGTIAWQEPLSVKESIDDEQSVSEAQPAAGPDSLSNDEGVLKEKRSLSRRKEDLDTIAHFVKVHVDDLEKMMGLVGELTILKNYFITETECVKNLKGEIEYASGRLTKEIDDFNNRYSHSVPEKIAFVDPLLEEFRELEFDRYDGINLFANSIKETTNDVNEALRSISVFFEQFAKHAAKLDKLNMEFREVISASRMVETGKLFQRFTRIVRDLCDRSGKRVNFLVKGGHTRIDKILYERLFTPILHLVRNSFSHGIESPSERLLREKPEEGSIILSANRDGNSVIIDIQDDGSGINLEKVYQKAVHKGLIADGEDISHSRLLSMLFMPGFSTYDGIDMNSGRGVGLDAVREIISEINGTISVASREGRGTIFRIRLPLTLIVVNIVKFRAGGLEFSVPSSIIQELMNVDASAYDREKGSVNVEGREIPLKDLCTLLNLKPRRTGNDVSLIVFNLLPGKETALLVDGITGLEDTVIKPLGGFLEGLKYYSGVSISADGKLVPVINPAGLLEAEIEEVEIMPVSEAEECGNTVLVVDDSLSVRKFAGIILEQNGYSVLTAPNGLEALTIIDEKHVDLILTDLEMPVMHGYEFLRELKRRGLTEKIPSIVLTSRASDKHREKATLLGARDYVVKPFEESTLVETIRRQLRGLCPAVKS